MQERSNKASDDSQGRRRQSQRPSSASSTWWYYIAALVALSGWAWSFRGRVCSPLPLRCLSCLFLRLHLRTVLSVLNSKSVYCQACPQGPLCGRCPMLGLSRSGTRVSSAQSLLLHNFDAVGE